MPKKKIEEIDRKLKRAKPAKRAAVVRRPSADSAAKKSAGCPKTTLAPDISQFPTTFENKAGRYELIRVDGDQAYYSFTNLQNKTVDATMPVLMWKKMQERAMHPYKESA